MTKIFKLSKTKSITFLIIGMFLILLLTLSIPTFSRYKNRITFDVEVWDGTIATKYASGTGTINDPYVISNGSELAYFQKELKNTDYVDTYFVLGNDIILNSGTFKYEDEKYIYNLDDHDYFITGNDYFETDDYSEKSGSFNLLGTLDNFKGNFNGNDYTIYGFFINSDKEAALFTNLEGNISNFYLKNSLVMGVDIIGGIVSSSVNSDLSALLFSGFVVDKTISDKVYESNIIIEDTVVSSNLSNKQIILDNSFNDMQIVSSKIIGDYIIDDSINAIVKINDVLLADNHFEIELSSNDLNIETIADGEGTLVFSNVKYEVIYKDSVVGGIVADADNVLIKNVINKGSISGNYLSGGLVGSATDLNITNAYNNGIIKSIASGGIIGNIDGTSNLVNVYNTYSSNSENFGSLIFINSGTTNIENSFDTTSNIPVFLTTTELNVINSYIINTTLTDDSFSLVDKDFLKNKENLIEYFSEFVSFEDLSINDNNVWVYEDDSLPLLYNDDINNKYIFLHVNVHTYDGYSPVLDTIRLEDNITFSIEDRSDTNNISKYYYISDKQLTRSELSNINDWIEYSELVTINNEGYYVVYVKTVDENDAVSYVNSDLLLLDLNGSNVEIKLDDTSWDSLKDNLQTHYINDIANIEIYAEDELSGIKSIEFFVANNLLTLEEIEEITWNAYDDLIKIDQSGKYVIYAKVVDNAKHITIINTDYILYDGYVLDDITSGRDGNTNLNITEYSNVVLNFKYSNNYDISKIGNHSIVTNVKLPNNTLITLRDINNNKVYEYSVDDNVLEQNGMYHYLFTNFNEKSIASLIYYSEKKVENEEYEVIISFNGIENDINNLLISLQLDDRKTLSNTLMPVNIYKNSNANLILNTIYNGESIIYNSDSTTTINIDSGIEYKLNGENIINDTIYDGKKQGIAIKFLNSENELVDKDYLKNIIFKLDGENYYPDNDNIVRIPFSENINVINKNLQIVTYSTSASLTEGDYNIEISNFVSYDGIHYDSLNDNVINIPVKIVNNSEYEIYYFDVLINDDNRIINKNSDSLEMNFKILKSTEIANPSVRVTLYKKELLTAYNQNYLVVDLQNYVTNSLTKYIDNVYLVNNDFNLNLIIDNFENTGYRLVFDLYDGEKKINTVIKNLIVR